MKLASLILTAWLVALAARAQSSDGTSGSSQQGTNDSSTSLLLFTNGLGRIVPFEGGQMLEVGRTYTMTAVPQPGYAFSNWTPLDVFTLVTVVIDDISDPGHPMTNTNVSVIISPLPDITTVPGLRFTMEPVEVLIDQDFATLTRSHGWQANFVARGRP